MGRVGPCRIYFLLFFSILTMLPFSCGATSFSQTIFIQEVQTRGAAENDEFIELKNSSATPLDISGWQLRRKTSGGSVSSIKVFEKNTLIPPHGIFLWANSKGIFATIADVSTSSSSLADNNSIALYSASGTTGQLIDSLVWGTGAPFDTVNLPKENIPKNTSLTRNADGSWQITSPSTPENSLGQFLPMEPAPPLPLPGVKESVLIYELLPRPDEGQEEFVELYNPGTGTIDISHWTLRDASKTGKFIIPEKTLLQSKQFLVYPRSILGLALNDSDEILSLFDTTDTLIHRVEYMQSFIGVSLNFFEGRLRGGTPTPGKENALNTLPLTKEKVPKEGYRDFSIPFDARGKDTEDNDLKYTWDFGDGHKSYKEKTTHTYEKIGTYTVTLRTKDSQDEISETFTLKIKKYNPPKIRIVSFLPNPSGKDSDNEWLVLENKSQKTVDLKNWSIATGSKKDSLVNHPLRESLTLDPGQKITLTRKDSLFTLPNQKGRIELRAPNGEVVDSVRYKEEKSIPEDILFQKTKEAGWDLVPLEQSSPVTTTALEEVPSDTASSSILPQDSSQVLGATIEVEDKSPEEKTLLKETLYKELLPLPYAVLQEAPPTAQAPALSFFQKKKDSFESLLQAFNVSLRSLFWEVTL